MPLEDLLPKLDDRTYDDLLREVRTRVARYAPEWRPGASAWTDVNDNDPGITLAQVFAWLSEMLLYRLNRVPALNYIKFLQLIGVELKPAEPAQAEVTAWVELAFPQPVVRIPERAQFSADPGDGGTILLFESKAAFVAFRAVLEAVVGYDPDTDFTSLTENNAQAAQPFEPFGPRAPEGAFLALGLQDAAALPPETLDLAFVAAGSQQGVPYATCSGGPTALTAPATLAWEYNHAGVWRSLTLLQDDTLALTRSGHVKLKLPAAGIPIAAKASVPPTDPTQRYWIRARVVHSQYEQPPRLIAIRTNTFAVEQAETIRDEVLGGSDGSRNQKFRIANRPVLANSLKLEIQVSDEGPDRWAEVADLFGSGPTDNHYMLNRATGEILTGDGVNGNVPVAYIGDPGGNVVAREYRVGGGRRGNVAANTITTLVTPVPGIDGAVTNLHAAHSGRDEESLEEAKKRAPSTLRSRDRAVTAGDFEYLASQAASIKRAKALPGFHPDFPAMRIPGVVSVVVVPDVDTERPMPSDATLRQVCRYLDERRLLTTEVFVLKPGYQQVEIRADIVALDTADAARVHADVVKTLIEYFHPLRGGDNALGWPFGGTIHHSRVYQRILGVAGVARIDRLTIVLDDEEHGDCTDVPIARHGLLYSAEHTVVVMQDSGDDV